MNAKIPLRVLIVEDSEVDAQILAGVLKQGGYDLDFLRVETEAEMWAALKEHSWDMVLSDFNLPRFSGPRALKTLQESGLDVPFIIVSGCIGDDTAVIAMKSGANDYVMKDNLTRLVPAVARELREAGDRAARRQAEQAMRESDGRYRLLWETCPDAVILIDTESTIHFANPSVKEVFGYTPEEIIGKRLAILQPEPLRDAHRKAVGDYLRTGIKRLNWRATETVGRRKDGTEFPMEVSFSDMELGGQRWFVGFVRDITERKRAEQELRDNAEQFRVAREIQQRLFPKASPEIPGFDIAGASHPAEATGGDYFDFIPMLDGGLGIVVADVAGHGMGPALLMAETRAYFRMLAQNRDDVGDILTRANRVLAEDVDVERFITLIVAKLDPRKLSLDYANAGHTPAYILKASGEVKSVLKRTDVPLGVQPDFRDFASRSVALSPGDLVIFVTDGIEEAVSPANEFFGIDRILDVVRARAGKSAREIVDALYQAARAFAEGQPQLDDVTLVIVKVQSGAH